MTDYRSYSEEYESFIQNVEENIEQILEENPRSEYEVPKLARKYVSRFDDNLSEGFQEFASGASRLVGNKIHDMGRKFRHNPYRHPVFAAQFEKAVQRLENKDKIERNRFKVQYNA